MRTEDSNNTHEKFEEFHRRTYSGVLQPATVRASSFLVVSEAAVSMFTTIGKTLLL